MNPDGASVAAGPLAPMLTARTELAAATGANGLIYALGGFNAKIDGVNALTTVEAYDPTSNVWMTRASIAPRRDLAAAADKDGRIYAIGGRNSIDELALVQAYDSASDTWAMCADMPGGYRTALSAALAPDGRIYVAGGYFNGSSVVARVEAYDPGGDTWATRAGMPTARSGLAFTVAVDGSIYAIGGRNDVPEVLATVEAYDPATDTWTTRASMPTARTRLAAVEGKDGRIYAIGGQTGDGGAGTGMTTVEAYDSASDTWSTRASMPTPSAGLAAVAGTDGRIYVIGGGGLVNPLATVQAYDPATDTWFQ